MAIFKLKKFSKSSLDEDYKDWKKSYDSGNRKESSEKAKKWMNRWTKEVYYPNKKKGILVDPDRKIVDDASGHTPPKGIMLKKKKFSGELARVADDRISDAVVLSESTNLPAVSTPKTPKPKGTGIMGGLKNTWKSGAKGKAGIIAGGAALLGAGALLGRKKDD